MITLLGNIALVGSALGFLVFVVRYGLLSRWWESPVGQNLMAFMASCLVILALGLVRMLLEATGQAEWFDAHRGGLRLFSFGLVFFVVWWRVVLLFKAQRSARDSANRRQ